MKVFWSWQSDLSTKRHREFVKGALERALALVSSDLNLAESERPELDHDTKGEAGLVEIAAAIFSKIEQAKVFVADVTPIAKTSKDKHVANPNVMIELGYALHALGREAIILVWNTDSGIKIEHLPFDLRHRRGPIAYTLPSGSSAETLKAAEEKLVVEFASALSTILKKALTTQNATLNFRRHPSRENMPSTWLQLGERIHHQDYFNGPGNHSRDPVETTRCYMRITPCAWRDNVKPRRANIQALRADHALPYFAGFSAGDGGANDLGFVKVGMNALAPETANVVTQWFDETAEIWGFSTLVTSEHNGRVYLSFVSVLRAWDEFLRASLVALNNLGAMGPVQIEVGVTGLKDTYWADGEYTPARALDAEVVYQFVLRDWGAPAQLSFIATAAGQLYTAFAKRPPNLDELAKILATS
ncbi:MAG TPA: hypothetical protein DDZ58_03105 [Achromobacter sp.]|nr:hypothetical protein [Achromobacter sp.]